MFAAVLPCAAQTQTQRVQITIEQKSGAGVRTVSAQRVFRNGDLIRFRLRPSFSGFLYVTNRSSSGAYLPLHPVAAADSRLVANRETVVPSGAGAWFRIDPPSGYDTVYFVMSAAPLAGTSAGMSTPAPLPPPPPGSSAPPTLLPRCDDSLLRARGECLDSSAGPRALPESDAVPRGLLADSSTASRDVVVVQKPDSAVVASGAAANVPVIYEFRIAHR